MTLLGAEQTTSLLVVLIALRRGALPRVDPGPTGVGDAGRVPPSGAAAAGAWTFSEESPDERAPWGAAPWTPA